MLNRKIVFGLLVLALIVTVFAKAQTRNSAPIAPMQVASRPPITLSPEVSKQWLDLNIQIENLRLRQQVLVLGEGVPKDYSLAGTDNQGRLVWVAPEPKASPK